MKKAVLYVLIIAVTGYISCKNPDSKTIATQAIEQAKTKTENMKNLVSIIEIPVSDFSRAVTFYQSILGVHIEATDMQGSQMGILPSEEATVNVVLVKGDDYKPSTAGTVVYLAAGDDLQSTLDKVEPNGGKVLVPKTEISPEMGFFALFTDTEGNKLGLHSKR
jgi:predicted enzyme related to lactoylglutathione lyase